MVDFIDAKIREYVLKHDMNDEASNLIQDAIKYVLEDDYVKWKIFNDYERYLRKEEILNEIDYIHDRDNTNIIINDEKLEDILLQYEDNLANSEDWHYCLKDALARYDIC